MPKLTERHSPPIPVKEPSYSRSHDDWNDTLERGIVARRESRCSSSDLLNVGVVGGVDADGSILQDLYTGSACSLLGAAGFETGAHECHTQSRRTSVYQVSNFSKCTFLFDNRDFH